MNALINDYDMNFCVFCIGSDNTGEYSKKKEKNRKRNVADEYGFDEGINEEYLFSPRQGKSQMYDGLSDTDDEPTFRFSMSESESDPGEYSRHCLLIVCMSTVG